VEQPAASNKTTSPIRTALLGRVADAIDFIIVRPPGGSEKGNQVQTAPSLGSACDAPVGLKPN
jgi:hypothetical protein